MQGQNQFDQLLQKKWNEKYVNHDSHIFRSDIKFMHLKQIEDGPFYAYFNLQWLESKRESQIQLQEADKESDVQQLVQDFDENAFNFTKVNKEEILFYLDLEEEDITLVEEQNKKQAEGSEYNFEHPLLVNISPLCNRHCILPPFVNEQLPQVLGGELVQLVLNIFSMTQNKSLRIGYNSIGGYSTVNHLHFQLIYAEDLFKEFMMFPIERFPRSLLFSTKLKSKEEMQMYSYGINISKVQGYPVRTFVLQPDPFPTNKQQLAEAYMSITFVLQIVIEKLLDHKVAHNVMFADDGLTIYIYPRQSQQLHVHQSKIKPAWVELGGLCVARDKQLFETITTDKFDQFLRDNCSITEQQFGTILTDFSQKIAEKFD